MKRHIDRIEGAHYERGYVYSFHYHLIFVTKYRRNVFTTPELVDEMKSLILACGKAGDFEIETMEVMPDHVHVLLSFKPKYAPTDIVKNLKGYTARAFFKKHPEIKHQKLWGGHLWSNSYYPKSLKTCTQFLRGQRIISCIPEPLSSLGILANPIVS